VRAPEDEPVDPAAVTRPTPAPAPAAAPAPDAAAADEDDVRQMGRVAAGGPPARAAFRRLFERHYPRVVRFCARYVGEGPAAEEAAQETFLRLYRARASYQPRARFRTFLLTIAQRVCWNELRRPARRAGPALSLDAARPGDAGGEGERPRLELADEDAVDPERRAAGREGLARVVAVLAEMPERQRAATVLHRFEGLAYEEVAETLGCTTRAVKSLLNRSRRLIVARLS
jgi:RNA polymerase sigma-70 factor (ECF subfamily)